MLTLDSINNLFNHLNSPEYKRAQIDSHDYNAILRAVIIENANNGKYITEAEARKESGIRFEKLKNQLC